MKSLRGNAGENTKKPLWNQTLPTAQQLNKRNVKSKQWRRKMGESNRHNTQQKTAEVAGWEVQRVGGYYGGKKTKAAIDASRRKENRVVRSSVPFVKAVATEAEKRRLQNTFSFKGGKALPDSALMAPIKGHIPLR